MIYHRFIFTRSHTHPNVIYIYMPNFSLYNLLYTITNNQFLILSRPNWNGSNAHFFWEIHRKFREVQKTWKNSVEVYNLVIYPKKLSKINTFCRNYGTLNTWSNWGINGCERVIWTKYSFYVSLNWITRNV